MKAEKEVEVSHHLTWLHVTADVATWDILLSIDLIRSLKGAINLDIVQTGEDRVALWLACGSRVH